jgi:hypothetical protein
MSARIAGLVCCLLILAGALYGGARAAGITGAPGTLLAARDGAYVDACAVVEIVPGQLALGDGSLVIPVVRVVLENRLLVVLAEGEGTAEQVAQSVVAAQDDCHRVTLSDAQLAQLAELLRR